MSDSGGDDKGTAPKTSQEDEHEEGPSHSSSSQPERVKKRKMTETESAPIDMPSTSGTQFPSWVAGASPARFIAGDELLKMSVAMEDLSLVHEIAIDPNFQISDVPKNPIEAAVKENMYRAYWDLLAQDLAKDPPEYKNALNLILEIKQIMIDDLLTSQQVRLKSQLESEFNETILRDQLDDDTLDVHRLSEFIIVTLSRLCAPARDELITKLRSERNIVEIIKGIFELMDLMKNDLANYALSKNREAVENYSAHLEYEQYQKYLEQFPHGADQTRLWITNAYDEIYHAKKSEGGNNGPNAKKERSSEENDESRDDIDVKLTRTTSRGYVNLVSKMDADPYPETMRIDKQRMAALAEKFLQMTVTTAAVFVSCNIAGKEVSESEGFKKTLKDHLIVITNDIDEGTLVEKLESVAEQCVSEVNNRLRSIQKESLSKDNEHLLRSQIAAISESTNAVRTLVFSRIHRFVEVILCSPSEVPRRLLPGLSVITSELSAFTARMLRICIHNRKAFADLYMSIILELQDDVMFLQPNESTEPDHHEEPGPSSSSSF